MNAYRNGKPGSLAVGTPRRTAASEVDGKPEWVSEDVERARAEDDVSGSGIFDSGGPNLHQGDGVFEDSYAMPGYAGRETGLGPSEVIDQQTGTPTNVFLPGMTNMQNGMWSTQPRYPVHPGVPEVPNFRSQVAEWDTQYRVPSQDTSFGLEMTSGRYGVPGPQYPAWNPGWGQQPTQAVNGLGDASGSAPLWQWAAGGVFLGVVAAVLYAKKHGS